MTPTPRIQIANVNALRREHDHFLAENERLLNAALEEAGDEAYDHVQRKPEFTRRTGKTQQATGHRVVRTSGGRVLRIFNTAKHARALESGARPHVIRAREGKVLAFRGRGGGMVFRKSVSHPGNRPYLFLFNATHVTFMRLRPRLERNMTLLAKRFSG